MKKFFLPLLLALVSTFSFATGETTVKVNMLFSEYFEQAGLDYYDGANVTLDYTDFQVTFQNIRQTTKVAAYGNRFVSYDCVVIDSKYPLDVVTMLLACFDDSYNTTFQLVPLGNATNNEGIRLYAYNASTGWKDSYTYGSTTTSLYSATGGCTNKFYSDSAKVPYGYTFRGNSPFIYSVVIPGTAPTAPFLAEDGGTYTNSKIDGVSYPTLKSSPLTITYIKQESKRIDVASPISIPGTIFFTNGNAYYSRNYVTERAFEFNRQIEDLNKQIFDLNFQLKELNVKYEEAKFDLSNAQYDLNETKEYVKALESDKNKLGNEVRALNELIRRYDEALYEDSLDIDFLGKYFELYRDSCAVLQTKNDALTADMDELRKILKTYADIMHETEERCITFNTENAQFRGQITKLTDSNAKLEAQVTELQASIDSHVCPSADTVYVETIVEKEVIVEVENTDKVDKLQAEVDELNKIINEMRREIETSCQSVLFESESRPGVIYNLQGIQVNSLDDIRLQSFYILDGKVHFKR